MGPDRDAAEARQWVAAGYDRMAERYTRARSPELPPLLASFVNGLDDGVPVLDLGCGAGVPVAAWLARRCSVTGVDVSARQVALARRNVPNASFLHQDMTGARFPAASFALAVAAFSIIHVPREEQPALIARIAGWLRPGGGFLASWATAAWEGEEENWEGWDAPMWWSHFGPDTSLTMLRDAGLTVGENEMVTVTGDGETWLWVLARKPAAAR
jgi:SAM-dependent methyltransferase